MKGLILALLGLGLVSSLWAMPELIIENPRQLNIRTQEIQGAFQHAYQLFAREIGPINRPFTISIAPSDCLRTGYNYVTNKIAFCETDKVEAFGLNSIDVINHEMFHAFICNYSSQLCSGRMRVDIHEGLADYFAYLLNPDQYFGEHFYLGFPYIRTYLTTWRPGLVQGDHERGNALASFLIQTRTSLRNALNVFRSTYIEEVNDAVRGVVKSPLNRYRLGRGVVMDIDFSFAPGAGVARVEWNLPRGLKVDRVGDKTFRIQIIEELSGLKAFAIFLAPNGAELGRRVYYFGDKI
jgi:hypothetical protein